MDQQTYIKAQDGRAVIVDSDGEDKVTISVHVSGGHCMAWMSRDQAAQLIDALTNILGLNHA